MGLTLREQGAEHLTAGRRARVRTRPRKASPGGKRDRRKREKHQGTSAHSAGLAREGRPISMVSRLGSVFLSRARPPSRRPHSGGLGNVSPREPYPQRALSATRCVDFGPWAPSVRDPARPALDGARQTSFWRYGRAKFVPNQK